MVQLWRFWWCSRFAHQLLNQFEGEMKTIAKKGHQTKRAWNSCDILPKQRRTSRNLAKGQSVTNKATNSKSEHIWGQILKALSFPFHRLSGKISGHLNPVAPSVLAHFKFNKVLCALALVSDRSFTSADSRAWIGLSLKSAFTDESESGRIKRRPQRDTRNPICQHRHPAKPQTQKTHPPVDSS